MHSREKAGGLRGGERKGWLEEEWIRKGGRRKSVEGASNGRDLLGSHID